MSEKAFESVGLVVGAESVDEGGAGFVESDEFDFGAFAAELQDNLVEASDGSQIPEMSMGNIDPHLGEDLLEIELANKGIT